MESLRSMSPVSINQDINNNNDEWQFKLSSFLTFIAHHEKQVMYTRNEVLGRNIERDPIRVARTS